jgi:DNA-dependent RNA polymerase auxiliary subunit epsilon
MTILMTTHAFDAEKTANLQRFLVFAEKAHTLYIEADSDTNIEMIYADNAPEYNVVTWIDKSANRQYWSVSTPFILDTIM